MSAFRSNSNSFGSLALQGGFDPGESDFISIPSSDQADQVNKEDIPSTIPILPMKNSVLFPGVVFPITAGRDKSIQLIQDAYNKDRIIGASAQKVAEEENPGPEDIYQTGTVAKILKLLRMPDGNVTVIIQGIRKFKIDEVTETDPYLKATIETQDEKKPPQSKEVDALVDSLKEQSRQIIEKSQDIPSEASMAIDNIKSYSFLVNFIAANMSAEVKDKQRILEISDFKKKASNLLELLHQELQRLELQNKIHSKVKTDIDEQQRQFYLQQQMKAIQEELGHESHDQEIANLEKRAQKKKWGEKVQEQFDKEIKKLRRMNPAAAEYSVVVNYLETLLELPWNEFTEDNYDMEKARKVLDEDHYGLEKVKERILEYLAVLKRKGNMKSPILCLLGPPGVGKTSLGHSLARSLNREYSRMSLGGLRDEAEIRGHRRTYIGSMPGRVIQNLRKAKSSNPVFVLDEIDKVGSDFRGDPASALLELLDPEQNDSFYDYYLELEYDLSHVMFIATANSLDNVHPALRDRLEVIDINGYLLEEKVEIAMQHLIPRQRERHGVTGKEFKMTRKNLEKLIEQYTRESGVRTLEKKIAALTRKRAKELVFNNNPSPNVSAEDIEKALGPPAYEKEVHPDPEIPGVATGLAYTPAGGELLFIEVSLVPGKGKLNLTGNLGNVMKESAMTALSYLKSRYDEFDIDPSIFENWDVHIHVPEGAIAKEGPSAGTALLTALVSAYTQRKVKPKIGMTGEITLRGAVLPVGGIQEKILAARRYGIKEVILCEQNRKNVNEIKESYLKGLTFHYVNNMKELLDHSLMKKKVKNAKEFKALQKAQ